VLGICDFIHKTPRQSHLSLTWPKGPGFSGQNKAFHYTIGFICRLSKRYHLIFQLTSMHKRYILMHMRTTLNIDDDVLEKAYRLTGIKEKTALVRLGLEALIARESSKRLAKLGGTEKDLRPIPRRRSAKL